MVYTRIKFENSAKIVITGDGEKIDITLYRSSTEYTHDSIRKHPGIFESLFPSYIDYIKMAPLLANEEQKEAIFRSRIKRCIDVYTDIANRFVAIDDMQVRESLAKQKAEEDQRKSISDYIEGIVGNRGVDSECKDQQ